MRDWRRELPTLVSESLTLREPAAGDEPAIAALLAAPDAARFGLDDPGEPVAATEFLENVHRARAAGRGFTFAIVVNASGTLVGLVQIRQLDPAFEGAEWEFTLAPGARGTGVFVEAARLIGTFAFGEIGVHRLEARVLLDHGRANGALGKLGAVQEGVLRRAVRRQGQYRDQMLWSLLKDDWSLSHVAAERRAR